MWLLISTGNPSQYPDDKDLTCHCLNSTELDLSNLWVRHQWSDLKWRVYAKAKDTFPSVPSVTVQGEVNGIHSAKACWLLSEHLEICYAKRPARGGHDSRGPGFKSQKWNSHWRWRMERTERETVSQMLMAVSARHQQRHLVQSTDGNKKYSLEEVMEWSRE